MSTKVDKTYRFTSCQTTASNGKIPTWSIGAYMVLQNFNTVHSPSRILVLKCKWANKLTIRGMPSKKGHRQSMSWKFSGVSLSLTSLIHIVPKDVIERERVEKGQQAWKGCWACLLSMQIWQPEKDEQILQIMHKVSTRKTCKVVYANTT